MRVRECREAGMRWGCGRVGWVTIVFTITVEKGKARRVVGTGTVKSIPKQVGLQKKA